MDPTVIALLSSLGGAALGGGVVKVAVEWWGKHKAARLAIEAKEVEAEIKGEDTARHFLQGAFTSERDSHARCLQRVTAIESAMFRQQYDHGKERDRDQAIIERLTKDNADLHKRLAIMQDALLASFVGETEKAKSLLASLPPPAPVRRLVKVDTRTE